MEKRPNYPTRKRNRLLNYDYSGNGGYFVTFCTEGRHNILSSVSGDGILTLKQPGRIAENILHQISSQYPYVVLENYVIMPNHIHLLLRIDKHTGTDDPSPTLGNIIGWYKYRTTCEINASVGLTEGKVFQRSYHDHVIRGEADYLKIWQYIEQNPLRWQNDCFYME